MARTTWRPLAWLSAAVESFIVVTCLVYLATNEIWALMAWEAVALVYLTVGLIVVWRTAPARALDTGERPKVRAIARWLWIPPLLSAAAGANSAVMALVARNAGLEPVLAALILVAATLGIILSWAMLQVGFAQIYQVIDAGGVDEMHIPGGRAPTTLDFLYFSFTVGASFATSDISVPGLRIRRVVLLHSVISFFYNAVVVAVAFQVLQGLASS